MLWVLSYLVSISSNVINITSYINSHINSDPIYTSQQSFLLVAGLLIAGLQLLPP